MDGVESFLDAVRKQGLAEGHLRGLLHALIGRKISTSAGAVISNGMTWRAAADLLKRTRWPIEPVRELSIDPDALPPRDRQRFWFGAIAAAGVDSAEAAAAGDSLAAAVLPLGFVIGPPPKAS